MSNSIDQYEVEVFLFNKSDLPADVVLIELEQAPEDKATKVGETDLIIESCILDIYEQAGLDRDQLTMCDHLVLTDELIVYIREAKSQLTDLIELIDQAVEQRSSMLDEGVITLSYW